MHAKPVEALQDLSAFFERLDVAMVLRVEGIRGSMHIGVQHLPPMHTFEDT